jgi:predicted MFS family arabinose efflux permease
VDAQENGPAGVFLLDGRPGARGCTIVEASAAPVQHPRPRERVSPFGLSVLFGLFYFIQGISEPTEGLISQPVLSLLRSWGQNAEQIGTFSFLLALPWAIKPVYGLISDFIPLAGYHRKSYLIVTSAVTAASLGTLYVLDLPAGAVYPLFVLLLLSTAGVAFSDVVVDALMIEKGQPHGLTGRLQSIQWGAMYAADVVAGSLGGYLSQHSQHNLGFLICGGFAVGTLVLSATVVSERRQTDARANFHATLDLLRRAAVSRAILAGGAFLLFLNFNPFNKAVLYLYMTEDLAFSEQFYGNTNSLWAISATVASLLYGLYCRRISMRILVHASILLAIVSTVAYWSMHDEASARVVSVAAGFAYATAAMVQLDLAAQICPPQTAGTLFALLMALSNLGTGLSTWLGGWCYEHTLEGWGNPLAFNVLVGIGAVFTAGCWLVVPYLRTVLPCDAVVPSPPGRGLG